MLSEIMDIIKQKKAQNQKTAEERYGGNVENIGNWEIQFNRPFGIILRNRLDVKAEYHFFCESNGWITTKAWHSKNNKAPIYACINQAGFSVGKPILVDRESTKKYQRYIELQKKGKNVTGEEAKEMLALSGAIEKG